MSLSLSSSSFSLPPSPTPNTLILALLFLGMLHSLAGFLHRDRIPYQLLAAPWLHHPGGDNAEENGVLLTQGKGILWIGKGEVEPGEHLFEPRYVPLGYFHMHQVTSRRPGEERPPGAPLSLTGLTRAALHTTQICRARVQIMTQKWTTLGVWR